MISGTIIKGIGGFYYIKTNEKVYECKARGKFRKENLTPVVGDYVNISLDPLTEKGVIEEISPRKTVLIRPSVANVSQSIIVFATKKPEPNLFLLDRFLVMVEKERLDIIICFNKIDLDSDTFSKCIGKIYSDAGYKVIYTSTKTGEGLNELKLSLKDNITVFAGPSGVGKSSLLNSVQANLQLQTGEISAKNKRGKHTTRHVELIELDFGGLVLDTPGFSSLDIEGIEPIELQEYFREFSPYYGKCKFNGCKHLKEPDCMIKEEVMSGHISQGRYDSYVQLLDELEKCRRY